MAPTAEGTTAMKKPGRGAGRVQLRQLPPIPERDLESLRAHVEQTIARSKKLREMAARTGYTPEDVASEALARYLGVADREIKNPAAWMVTAGRNFVYDLHKKGVHRETASEPSSVMFDKPQAGEQPPVDESLDRRYEAGLYDAAIRLLEESDRRAIAAFEQEGSMRAVEKRYGIPKSNVQRAFKRLQRVIVDESGEGAPRRARSRALAYHLGLASQPQREELKARMSWDTALLMEVRSLEHGARRTVALFPAVVVGGSEKAGSGLADRFAALSERARETVQSLLSRGGGHEAEAAAGAGLTGGGFATKAIVAACIGGSAAGVCVERGVVPLPGVDGGESQSIETTTSERSDPRPGGLPDLGTADETPTGQGETNVVDSTASSENPKPAAQVSNELGFEQSAPSSASSSGGGEFGAPSGGGSSGGGSGGGGFGFEK